MSKLTRILIVVLLAAVCADVAYLSNAVYNLQNRVAEDEVKTEWAVVGLANCVIGLAGIASPRTEMIEAVTPTVVYCEAFTGEINLYTGKPVSACGAGVVIGDGLILTVKHLAQILDLEGSSVRVTLKDGTVGNVLKWACDPNSDLAVMKVDIKTPCVATIAGQNDSKPGDRVWVIGSPFGLKWTVTAGIISRVYDLDKDRGSFMIDAPMNPGNSGSPVFDQNGNVIGIAFAIMVGNDTGFVVGVDYINQVIESLIEAVRK